MEDNKKPTIEWIMEISKEISKREGIDEFTVARAVMLTLLTGKTISIVYPRRRKDEAWRIKTDCSCS